MEKKVDYALWLSEIRKSNSKYSPLFVGKKANPPIFFFGDPENAAGATICLNPSATEFENRKWDLECIELSALLERCRNYFNMPEHVPRHQWFEKWEPFLEKIGVSYCASPRVIHLDLSPRATLSVSSLQKSKQLQDLFLDLVENDLKYLFGQLRAYPSLKYLYLMGSVTKKYYAIEFLRKNAQRLGYVLNPIVPFKRGGPGQVGLYMIDLGDPILRYLFFCSTSPSDPNSSTQALLLSRAQWLLEHYPEFLPSGACAVCSK